MEASSHFKFGYYIIAISVLQWHVQYYCAHGQLQGVLMLSPQGIAHVCEGDQLELTCTTTMNTVLDWIIVIPGNARNLRRSVSTGSISTEIPLNSTRLIFSRISEVNADPLISTLLISSVSNDLNGTEVDCMVGGTTLSTVVNIISDKSLTIESRLMELFESDGVTVTLEWHKNSYFDSYYVSVTPNNIIAMRTNGSIHLKLKVPYNTFYNVSILATRVLPCGINNVTNFTELFYPHDNNCGNPADQLEESVIIVNQNVFPVPEGSNITFSCPPGRVLIGSNMAECMENGEWEPNPWEVKCSVTIEHFALNQTGVTVITSVIVSVVTAIIFFIVGFVSSHCYQKAKRQKHVVEELQHGSSEAANIHSQERALELQENVSYASVY